jgi:two-component system chemotaxis response regulator CheB
VIPHLSQVYVSDRTLAYRGHVSATGRSTDCGFDLIVMVASLGGLSSVSTLLAALPDTFPVPVLLAQHGKASSRPDALPYLLQRRTTLPVRAGEHGMTPARGVTVMARGCTTTIGADSRLAVIRTGLIAQGDALLISAAELAAPRVIGVVLTGMLYDGTEGIRAVKRRGGRVLVEDPATARASGMPSSAIATGCVDFILPAHRIAVALIALTMAPGAAALLAIPPPAWARLHPQPSTIA